MDLNWNFNRTPNAPFMKTKKTIRLLLSLSLFFLFTQSIFANSDPALTDFSTLKSEVVPGEEIDFILSYGNGGSVPTKDAEIIINFNENQLQDISLGNPKTCEVTSVLLRCPVAEIPVGSSAVINFTAKVGLQVKANEAIRTTARIEEFKNSNDNIQNNFKENILKVSASAASASGLTGLPFGSAVNPATTPLSEPSKSQELVIFDVSKDPNWKAHSLATVGLKFLIRSREALAWTLKIQESHSENIGSQRAYQQVLTVVNGFFIIGLLAIAVMWIFSLFMPRHYLRNVILIYGLAVILVNFALPFNQLLVQGANILQNTFLRSVNIEEITKTPAYSDQQAVVYQNQSSAIQSEVIHPIKIKLDGVDQNGVPTPQTEVGQIKQDFLNSSLIGTIDTTNEKGSIELRTTGDPLKLNLKTEQLIQVSQSSEFNPYRENGFFIFIVLALNGLAYFLISLVFILRVVILWALLIVSPALLFLAIFRATRGYFNQWLNSYVKWLLIGPLLALALSLVISIWQLNGIPILSDYNAVSTFGSTSNIGFYLPGNTELNTLKNSAQMMEYLLFLVMLYVPVLFAFILTKSSINLAPAYYLRNTFSPPSSSNSGVLSVFPIKNKDQKTEGQTSSGTSKLFLEDSKIKQVNAKERNQIPDSLKSFSSQSVQSIQTVKPFNAESIKNLSLPELLHKALDEKNQVRHPRQKAIQLLANPDSQATSAERKRSEAIFNEIGTRAQAGNLEAIQLMSEIQVAQSYQNNSSTVVNNESQSSADHYHTYHSAQSVSNSKEVKNSNRTTDLKSVKSNKKAKPEDQKHADSKSSKQKPKKSKKDQNDTSNEDSDLKNKPSIDENNE